MVIPGYLTTKQSEERPRAAHTPHSPQHAAPASSLYVISEQNPRSWCSRTGVHLLPRVASLLNKTIFPFCLMCVSQYWILEQRVAEPEFKNNRTF